MKVHLLQQGRSVRLPVQLLLVRVQSAAGGPPPELDAVVVGDGGREDAVVDAERHPGTLVLAVSEPTTIRLRPPRGAATFAPESTVGLSIGGDSADADRVVLNSVDPSGLRFCDLVTLVPTGDEIVVSAVTATSEPELPPLAARARTAARALQADHGGSARVDLQVVVDASASMRPFVRSGWLERALELVMGATQAVSSSPRVSSSLCGQVRTDLGDQPLDAFAAVMADAAARRAPSVGFRSALVPDGGERTLTYLLTDGVPADLDPARSDRLHLVLLAAPGDDPTPGLSDGASVTVLAPDRGSDDGLDQARLVAAVRSLLSGSARRSERGLS